MSDVTRILDRVQQGDSTAADQLLPLVYDELRKLAAQRERLLEAYHEKRTCPPAEKWHWAATFERLLTEAFFRKPGASRDELLNALAERYAEFRRQR